MDEKYSIILESRERLSRINPWRIDLIRELNKIIEYFNERALNYIIAGITAENSAFIYRRKVETIDRINKPIKRPIRDIYAIDKPIKIPVIEYTPIYGKPLIDLTGIIERLEEIIERSLTPPKSEEDMTVTEYIDQLTRIQDEIDEIWKIINNAFKITGGILKFTDIIRTLNQYSPYMVLFTLLFYYSEGKIDIDIIEENGLTQELIIFQSSSS